MRDFEPNESIKMENIHVTIDKFSLTNNYFPLDFLLPPETSKVINYKRSTESWLSSPQNLYKDPLEARNIIKLYSF